MRTPSKQARLQLWKVTFARSSFIQTMQSCEALLQLPSSSTGAIITALSTSALVFYARPFKQKPEVKLDNTIVPREFAEFHTDIISYRDKVVAHRDVKAPTTPWGSANDIVFCWASSSMEIQTTSPILEGDAAKRLRELSVILIAAMDKELTILVQQHLPPPLEDGHYTLSLRGDVVEWLVKQP